MKRTTFPGNGTSRKVSTDRQFQRNSDGHLRDAERKVQRLDKGKSEIIANFSARIVTSFPSLSLSHSLSLSSLSLSLSLSFSL